MKKTTLALLSMLSLSSIASGIVYDIVDYAYIDLEENCRRIDDVIKTCDAKVRIKLTNDYLDLKTINFPAVVTIQTNGDFNGTYIGRYLDLENIIGKSVFQLTDGVYEGKYREVGMSTTTKNHASFKNKNGVKLVASSIGGNAFIYDSTGVNFRIDLPENFNKASVVYKSKDINKETSETFTIDSVNKIILN